MKKGEREKQSSCLTWNLDLEVVSAASPDCLSLSLALLLLLLERKLLGRGVSQRLPYYSLLTPPDIWHFKRRPLLSGSLRRRQGWPPLPPTPPSLKGSLFAEENRVSDIGEEYEEEETKICSPMRFDLLWRRRRKRSGRWTTPAPAIIASSVPTLVGSPVTTAHAAGKMIFRPPPTPLTSLEAR